ncbi:vancomycin resistance protein [Paenibacillus spiritus]|uniref:Vancomycin resistance protein n=1 Tax=Paenibacillus spiritus TaxID=2496557 RepID=A0A5J5FVZ2_9BACL|nr:VanW family protein [Paenibacillus spiritus]KAA8997942.1 vancomycin resistance protein [Paenibacillus spiritus]
MRKWHGALVAGTGLALLLSLLYGGAVLYTGQRTVPSHVRLAGLELGGRPLPEARAELKRTMARMERLSLSLRDDQGEAARLTLAEAGVVYRAETLLHALDSLGEGGLWERVRTRWTFPRTWRLEAEWNSGKLRGLLNAQWQHSRYGEAVNAVRTITPDDRIAYAPGRSSRQIDWTALESRLLASLPREPGIDAPAGPEAQPGGPEDAVPRVLDLPLAELPPAVTEASLRAQGVSRLIVSMSTPLGASGPGRVYNVESAARAVNDTLIPPAGIFDYGLAIDKAARTTGFRQAPVIVNGRLTPGVGGGICQVSSTLYGAALRLGLDIVERRNHSLPVSYLPKGQDATFAQGSINFRFRNTTGHYLLIRSEVRGRTLTVKMYGTFPRGIVYEVRSSTVDILAPGERRVIDASVARGASRTLVRGKAGYVVETYLIRREDGQVTGKTLVSRDTYWPQQRVVAVAPGSAAAPSPSSAPQRRLVEDGVSGE